jgi:hypothetical protein
MTSNLEPEEFETRLQDMLDYILQRPKLEPAARYVGYSSKYIWTILKRSNEGDPKYLVRWPDRESEERIQFSEAVVLARRLWKVRFDNTLREDVERGIPEVQTFAGEVIWEKDAALLAKWGGDTLQAKRDAEDFDGVYDYPYKHRVGPTGQLERIPLTLYRPAPSALRQHVARSILPEIYNPPEHRSTDVQHSGAVLILGHAPYSKNYVAPDSPMKRDLQQRLADLRTKGPTHKHAVDVHGRKTIPKIGNGSSSNDPPEKQGYGLTPQVDADGHIVGAKAKPMISSGGVLGPGGYSLTTGNLHEQRFPVRRLQHAAPPSWSAVRQCIA